MKPMRKRVLKLAFVVVPILLLFSYLFFVQPMSCSHDYMKCDSSIREINIALWSYAEDHDNNYPSELKELHPDYLDLTKNRCFMHKGSSDPLDTGFQYIPGLKMNLDENKAILFCKNYHLNGHASGPYRVEFSILLQNGSIVHPFTSDLRKYNGPKRRYVSFWMYPYDGSKPSLELVKSLEERFPEKSYKRSWMPIDLDEDSSPH